MSDERKEALAEIAAEALRHLTWLQEAGRAGGAEARPARVRGAAAGPAPGCRRQAPAAAPPEPPRAAPPPTAPPEPARPPQPARAAQAVPPAAASAPAATSGPASAQKGCGSPALAAIRDDLGDCRRCKLAAGRTTLVFGVGSPTAELMFVGEGPGADEDVQGEPFVGRAGQLLTKMIEAMGYRRDQVYIANVVKCRPPGNRNPEPDEIEACEPFLRRQIEAVGPKVIVALGKFAAQTLLRSAIPITKLRGTWSELRGRAPHADLPPGLPAPQPGGEEEGLGGPAAGHGGARERAGGAVRGAPGPRRDLEASPPRPHPGAVSAESGR